jgi:hypothetical protein
MATIDYTIPGQFKGIQIEPPMNAMARAMELRGLQEASNLNALRMQEQEMKMGEAQRLNQQRNELAKIHADPNVKVNSPEYLSLVRQRVPDLYEQVASHVLQRTDLEERIEGRKAQNFERKFKLFQSITPSLRTIDDVTQFVAASYADPDLGPVLTQIRPYEVALTTNQDAFNEDPDNWRLQAAGVSPKEIAEIARNKAKEEREANKPVVVGDKLVSPAGNVIFSAESKALAPSRVVQLQTELESAKKTYGVNSPQVKQIQDEIEQETGGLERQRIAIDRYRSRKGEGGGTGDVGPGTKLEKGERWNVAEQRIETVPGSKLHVAQSDKHNKDREALKGVETKTQSAISKIDELLSPKYIDGFRANFSGDIPYSGAVTQYFAPDARRRIDSLKSDMKAAGLELIRVGGSIGAMTQQEWPIVEQMIAALTPDMSAQEAETQVKKIRAYMEKIKSNAKDAYQTEWGDTQYFKPTEKPGDQGATPNAVYSDAEKERRYQAWKAKQGKVKP